MAAYSECSHLVNLRHLQIRAELRFFVNQIVRRFSQNLYILFVRVFQSYFHNLCSSLSYVNLSIFAKVNFFSTFDGRNFSRYQ